MRGRERQGLEQPHPHPVRPSPPDSPHPHGGSPPSPSSAIMGPGATFLTVPGPHTHTSYSRAHLHTGPHGQPPIFPPVRACPFLQPSSQPRRPPPSSSWRPPPPPFQSFPRMPRSKALYSFLRRVEERRPQEGKSPPPRAPRPCQGPGKEEPHGTSRCPVSLVQPPCWPAACSTSQHSPQPRPVRRKKHTPYPLPFLQGTRQGLPGDSPMPSPLPVPVPERPQPCPTPAPPPPPGSRWREGVALAATAMGWALV